MLEGCVVAAAPHHERVDMRITTAPPPPRLETPPPPESLDAYWVAGHWRWDGRGYAWQPGHWVQSRPGFAWQSAWSSNEGGYWVHHPGQWVRVAPPQEPVRVVIAAPPPPPRVEVMTIAPSPVHVWISGYWGWSGARHEWVAGHWEAPRPGHFWVPGHWSRGSGGWEFAGGYWQRH
jgi:hypothetical protein